MAGFADIQLSPEVARGVVRGERHAVDAAYRLLVQAVMNLAARILQDRQLAEEVVQDTFVELMEKARQIKDANAVVPWVRRVAVNHCLMRLRSPWHARRESAEEQRLEQLQDAHDGGMEWAGQVPGLERALGLLSEEARAVLWLHDVEGYTHREIGELMGKTTSFSKSQLARAYDRLLAWHKAGNAPGQSQPQSREVPHAGSAMANI